MMFVKPLARAGALFLAFMATVCPVPHAQMQEKPKPLVLLDLPAPALIGTSADWLNTGGKPETFERGRVYAVHFYAFGCGNCKKNLPVYTKWQQMGEGLPFTVIGIHTPETEKEKNPANTAEEAKKQGMTYPLLIDGKAANWKRWQQQMWPTVYLVDKRGHVRAYWVGELEWQGAGGTRVMEELIGQLLREPAPLPGDQYPAFRRNDLPWRGAHDGVEASSIL